MKDYSLRRRPKKFIDQKGFLKDEELRRRTRFAINYIADTHNLINETIAPAIGAKVGTLANYRAMNTSPKAEFIRAFCEKYNFSEIWFLKGKGEPFPGAYQKYPEICGPAGSVPEVHEPTPPYGALVAEQKINIEEAVGKAYKILSSGTAVAAALYLNIQQFAVGLDTSRELKECKDQLAAQQREIDELKRKMERLEAVPVGAAEVDDPIGKKTM